MECEETEVVIRVYFDDQGSGLVLMGSASAALGNEHGRNCLQEALGKRRTWESVNSMAFGSAIRHGKAMIFIFSETSSILII